MPARLTLLVPGILGPWQEPAAAPARDLSLPALQRLLSRADPLPGPTGLPDTLLLGAFGHRAAEADPPVAAVTAAADLQDREPRDGWWMRADPVHLRADRDTLVLVRHGDLGLGEEEAARLVDELREVFAPRRARLYMGHPERWYLHLPGDPAVRTHAPAATLGRDLRPYMPYGDAAASWHALMNEAQMQLNLSPVNRERENRGRVAVNSLWFWGGGAAPRVESRWHTLWADGPTARGLARLGGIACRPTPPVGAAAWLTAVAGDGEHLMVLDAPGAALQAGDVPAWQAALRTVNDRWMQPLVAAVGRGELSAMTLATGGGTDYVLTGGADRRWWRRTGPLARFLATPC